MSGKSIVLVVVAALFGSLVSAAVMRYVQPIGRLVMTAPAGIPFLDRPADEATRDDHQNDASHHDDLEERETHQDHDAHADHEQPGHDHHDDRDHERHAHEEHRDHADHGAHGEEPIVQLSEAEQREFGIAMGTAGSGALRMHVIVPGKVALNADQQAHIVPRVSGVVRAVYKTLGDQVRAGDVLATLESRELADLKSAYLTAQEQQALAQSIFDREADLRQKHITSEQEYLQAKQDLAAAKIATRAAAQNLRALGLSNGAISQLPKQPGTTFSQYAITAPFDGTVIERHIALGEVLRDDTAAFVVADLSTVWVDLQIYPRDLPFVRQGQAVAISADQGMPEAQGTIAYMGPVVGEQTRTALARVVLPNPEGHWRPGLFVTADITIERHEVSLLIPETALQMVDAQPTVIIETSEGFVPQPVALGRRNAAAIEVMSGLEPGQRYVTRGAFTLKAQLAKGSFGHGHVH